MEGNFKPAWWCRGPHMQTLWARLVRYAPPIELRRERLELSDGDFIDLDWTKKNQTGPIVIVLHGLEGSSSSPYALGILKAIEARGWRGVVMHFRGCSGEVNRLPRSYHSGDTGDLAFFVDSLRRREPRTRLATVGYSLGGNVLLKWLGTTREQAPLSAAVAVSVPFVLRYASERLQQGFSRLYQWKLMRTMRASVMQKQRRMDMPLRIQDITTLKNFRDFDEHVTARLHGFDSADHYYAVASSRQYLQGITVPTLVLHARDDPFMSEKAIPRKDEFSSAVTLEVSAQGGHVGFVSGAWPWRPRYWLEQRIPEFLDRYLK
ncbi:MAG: hydrolase [Gammaproteobacteria bacterium]|nr:hydrolase [Gammaproteobacteria bacterium]